MSNQGIIFNIQKYSIHDGPGIRTTIFLKGCNLRCPWCHNMESIQQKKEITWDKDKCKHCMSCISACPNNALSFDSKNNLTQNTKLCEHCLKCTTVCPNSALEAVGEDKQVQDLVQMALKDKKYFDASEGGITISGGEPLLQSTFVAKLLKQLKSHNIHTALDTAGFVNWSCFEKVIPYTDAILLDIKSLDHNVCKNTLKSNLSLYLKNFEKLKQFTGDIYIRVPLIPGVTTLENNLTKIVALLKEYSSDSQNIKHISLLPYHKMGSDKNIKLFNPHTLIIYDQLNDHKLTAILEQFKDLDIPVTIG